jgi:hypothetical protein
MYQMQDNYVQPFEKNVVLKKAVGFANLGFNQ